MQNGRSDKKLPPLPPNDSYFWKKAEKYTTEISHARPGCEHYFEQKTGREVTCRKCNIGFYLSPDIYIKDGQIVAV